MDSMNVKMLAARMRRGRARAGVTQADAAAQAGVSTTTWRQLEAGRASPRMLTVAAVERFLDDAVGETPPAEDVPTMGECRCVAGLPPSDRLLVAALVGRLRSGEG